MEVRHPRNILVQMLWTMGRCLEGECNRMRCTKADCPMIHLIHEMDGAVNEVITLLPPGVEKKRFR